MNRFVKLALLITCLVLSACATKIKASKTQNPPPLEQFSKYSNFELMPIELAPLYANKESNQKAMLKIQENFDTRVRPTLTSWNGRSSKGVGTLLIEPRIEQIKFNAIGIRILAGPFAGSSAVVMKVRYTDKASGKVIAEPEFFQRASAMSGATTFGGQDNAMLARIASLVANYNDKNYDQRIGGDNGEAPDTELNVTTNQ